MNQRDSKATFDGFSSLEGGQDSGRAPHMIAANQSAKLVNMTVRGGYPATRPAWNRIDLEFADAEEQVAFEDGRFQGAETHCNNPKMREIVASVSGRLWRVRVNGKTQAITTYEDRNSSRLEQCWMEQVEGTLVVQDGQSKPILYSGGSWRRAEWDEVPVGTVMSYTNGRLWVAMPNGRDFVAGDLLGTDTGPLKFTENDYLSEGGAFQVPASAGKIVALRETSVPDTSLGEGELLVICQKAVYAVNVPFDRDLWKATSYPIMRALLLGAGGVGGWAAANVNSDVFMRSRDGVRSIVRAQRDFASWGNTPLSNEVSDVTGHDDPRKLDHCSMALFDNRLLTTYGPIKSGDNIVHEGVTVLEFDLINGMQGKAPPAWSGVWKRDDVRILKLVEGVFDDQYRCFVFGLDDNDKIGLWEITKDERFDDGDTVIEWQIDSRSMNFGNQWSAKKLAAGEVWADSMAGVVSFTAYWRPDQNETECDVWRTWHDWSYTIPYQDCISNDGTCHTPVTYPEQYRPRKILPLPGDDSSADIGRPYSVGNEFQVRLTGSGRVRIKRLMLKAYQIQEDVTETIV